MVWLKKKKDHLALDNNHSLTHHIWYINNNQKHFLINLDYDDAKHYIFVYVYCLTLIY
jgi:hypothetical protein